MSLIARVSFALAMVAALAASVNGQRPDTRVAAGGPFSLDAVVNAPFSADARTTVKMQLPDGSTSNYTVTARYYRNSEGRARAEVDTPGGALVVVEIPPGRFTPDHDPFYVLNLGTRAYTRGPGLVRVAQLFNGEARVALPVTTKEPIKSPFCFQIAPPVIADASDEERLQAVGAQVAPDLGIVIESHRSDAIGSIDYRVTNIRRGEPAAELFDLTTYALLNGSTWASGAWQSPPNCGPREK